MGEDSSDGASWQKASGYHRQSRVENTFFRYKSIIGDGLRARSPTGQGREAVLGCEILNRMTALGRPRVLSHRQVRILSIGIVRARDDSCNNAAVRRRVRDLTVCQIKDRNARDDQQDILEPDRRRGGRRTCGSFLIPTSWSAPSSPRAPRRTGCISDEGGADWKPQTRSSGMGEAGKIPCFCVLAGANGAGKSTFAGDVFLRPHAKPVWPKGTITKQSKRLELAIAQRCDYSFQTPLSNKTVTGRLEMALSAGIEVRIWYVGLSSPELHIARVRARGTSGGKNIPDETIRNAYYRSRQQSDPSSPESNGASPLRQQ